MADLVGLPFDMACKELREVVEAVDPKLRVIAAAGTEQGQFSITGFNAQPAFLAIVVKDIFLNVQKRGLALNDFMKLVGDLELVISEGGGGCLVPADTLPIPMPPTKEIH